MSGLTDADERTLEALVRLQLTARRLGASICLHKARDELVDLLALVGFSDVLPVISEASAPGGPGESAVEPDRQVEEWKQVRVDEEVDPGDAAG